MQAQSSERDYAFQTLGWYQFEKLCRTILCDILGQTVEFYSSGNDVGSDASFSGIWSPQQFENMSGSFTFQVKYSRKQNAPLHLSTLSEDLKKTPKLKERGYLDNYIVLTNHSLTGARADVLRDQLREKTGAQEVRLFAVDWLSRMITDSSQLRMLLPRVYGLGDLGEILNARAYEQAKAILSWMPALRTIVTTDGMQQAARVLKGKRFVFLIGDAMAGKTTAASALAIAALDDLKLSVLKIRTASEFAAQWNANPNSGQFFWIDDAFGETSYDDALTKDWGRHLDALAAAISSGANVVMTSRNYIWENAREVIKTYAFEFFKSSEVIIRLQDLSTDEKLQMLYNHLRMGDQQAEFKRNLRPLLPSVASIEPFYPEAARRLASKYYTRQLHIDSGSIETFFKKPLEILIDIIGRLSAAEKALLAMIFANGGRLKAPVTFDNDAMRFITLLGAEPREVIAKTAPMLGVFINHVTDLDGSTTYRFIHPSLADAFAQMTARKAELLDIYLAGATTLSVLRETSAGRPGIEGVVIVVPETHYSNIIERIARIIREHGTTGTYWTSYLSKRSGRAFLKYTIENLPIALEEQYYYDEEFDPVDDDFIMLCGVLRKFGLLAEEKRHQCVRRIKKYLCRDLAFLSNPEISQLLRDADIQEIDTLVKEDTGRLLREMREFYDEGYILNNDPSDYYGPALVYIDQLEAACNGSEKAIRSCESARDDIAEIIEEATLEREARKSELNFPKRSFDFAQASASSHIFASGRNIFSDVADPI